MGKCYPLSLNPLTFIIKTELLTEKTIERFRFDYTTTATVCLLVDRGRDETYSSDFDFRFSGYLTCHKTKMAALRRYEKELLLLAENEEDLDDEETLGFTAILQKALIHYLIVIIHGLSTVQYSKTAYL